MGLIDTVRATLGLQRPLQVVQPTTLALSKAARDALNALPSDRALHLECVASELGHRVRLTEGARTPPATAVHPALLAIEADLERVAQLTLDLDGGRWRVSVALDVRARETPNPDTRLYLCSRHLLAGERHLYVRAGDANQPVLARVLLAIDGVQAILLRGNSVSVARTSAASWSAIDHGVGAALRTWLLACGRALSPADLGPSDDPLLDEILAVLERTVLPGIRNDGGGLELLGVRDGVVRVHLIGACVGCPASALTLKGGIERVLIDAFPNRVHSVIAE